MAISASDLPALSRLIDEAVDVEPASLPDWLERLDAEVAHLAPLLRDVLAARDRGATADLLSTLHSLALPGADGVAAAGEIVGPYRLIRLLGQGGMGTVWLAERADGSYTRQVALKLPRLTWDNRLAQRMERERAIGARLEHPNIARMYDAGVDDRGRPFIAFEYIDGQPIDAWCNQHARSARDPLRLGVHLARALAYAHGRLVVHRDLKPSNVLVSADGNPHLLDFGIAKLLDGDDAGGLTREHGRAMTLQYASPEQVHGDTVTVASDIYSLGALLYELLTGQCSYPLQRNTIGALEQAILEGEPAPASHRVSEPAKARALRGEIDAILAKALRRDPAQRYATAEAFAADIERHLNGNVVLARPYSLRYRLGKTWRRHRLAIGAAGALSVAVLAGTAVSLLQAGRANAEAERATQVTAFMVDIFGTRGGPDGSLGQMPGHALLERVALKIDQRFANRPLLQAELYGLVSDMFYNIANEAQTLAYARHRVEALRRAQAEPALVARALLRVSELAIPMDLKDVAESSAREALAMSGGDPSLAAYAHARVAGARLFVDRDTRNSARDLDAAERELSRGTALPMDRAMVTFSRGSWYAFSGRPNEARAKFDATIELALATEGPHSETAKWARLEAAKTLMFDGQHDAGKRYLAPALQMMRELGGPNDVNAALWEAYAAAWMAPDGISFAEALRIFERSLATLHAQKWWSPDDYISRVEGMLGRTLLEWGDIERGSALILRAPPLPADAAPLARWWRLVSTINALIHTDRAGEASALAREALLLQQPWQEPTTLRQSYNRLILTLVYARRLTEAEEALDEYRKISAAAPDEPGTAGSVPHRAVLLLALESGRFPEVIELTAHLPPQPEKRADEIAWLSRAAALCQSGRTAESLPLFDEWLPRLANDRYDASPLMAYWRAQMGACALTAGRTRLAAELSAMASSAIARQPQVSPFYTDPVRALQRRLATEGRLAVTADAMSR